MVGVGLEVLLVMMVVVYNNRDIVKDTVRI